MNDADVDRTLEHEVRAILGEHAPSAPPSHLLHRFEDSARRARRLPRWLALSKEPTMRIESQLAVGSPTARGVAVLTATLLLALALAAIGVAGQRLLAADQVIVVAQDGSGDHTAIADAVEAAVDGDTIFVRPGTYAESVVIDKDITLAGEGDVADIVVSAPNDGPKARVRKDGGSEAGYAFHLIDSNADVSGLTFSGRPSQVLVTGGSPTIHDLVMEGVDQGDTLDVGGSISIGGGSTATVRDNRIAGGASIMTFDASRPIIERNDLRETSGIYGYFGDGAVVRGNRIWRPAGSGIRSMDPADIEISANEIVDPSSWGIELAFGPGAEGTTVTVSDNTISGAEIAALSTAGLDGLEVTGNTFRGNGTAVAWNADHGLIADNIIEDGAAGIVISQGAPEVRRNSIAGQTGRGLVVGAATSPTIADNRSCGNNENFFLDPAASPRLDGGNYFCPDGLPT
jgi:nitrous oxidase accessory protein NosD